MQYKQIVVYDVPQEYKKYRQKIIQKLQDYGMERIQYSVFGGVLTKEETENLIIKLKELKTENKVDIRIFIIKRGDMNNSGIIVVSEAAPPHPSTKTISGEKNREVILF